MLITQRQFTPTISITEAHVRTALKNLLYQAQTPQINPLSYMGSVEQFLLSSRQPLTTQYRDIALARVLTSSIVCELHHHRAMHSLALSNEHQAIEAVLKIIAQDVQTGNPELISWSCLYYRYVRVDLNISPALFSQVAHCDERTVRRYHQHGIRRLTQRLIEAEWKLKEPPHT